MTPDKIKIWVNRHDIRNIHAIIYASDGNSIVFAERSSALMFHDIISKLLRRLSTTMLSVGSKPKKFTLRRSEAGALFKLLMSSTTGDSISAMNICTQIDKVYKLS